MTAVWKALWALQVPNAEKNFLWRACLEILPTRANLYKRHIVQDPLCPICGREEETRFHILWQCPSTMDVWSMGNKKPQKSVFLGPHFIQVVEGVFGKCSPDEVREFVGLARRIWMRRNEVVHGGLFTHPSVLLKLNNSALTEFQTANVLNAQVPSASVQQQIHWEAPLTGWLKANWDAGINRSQGCTGFGIVIRDCHGHFVAAKCASRQGLLTLAGAEITGALMAVQLCSNMGLARVHFEGDAKGVIDAINSVDRDLSNLGHVVADVRTEVQGISH